MSKKNKPDESAFGSLEDDFFNAGSAWGAEPAA